MLMLRDPIFSNFRVQEYTHQGGWVFASPHKFLNATSFCLCCVCGGVGCSHLHLPPSLSPLRLSPSLSLSLSLLSVSLFLSSFSPLSCTGEFHLRLRHLEQSLLQALNEVKGRILDDDR